MRRRRAGRGAEAEEPIARKGGMPRALALTLASVFVWGVAHLAARRRLAGGLLFGVFTLLVTAGVVAGVVIGWERISLWISIRPDWLAGIALAVLALGLVWVTVVIRSYRVVQPAGASLPTRLAGRFLIVVLCVLVAAPSVWAAHLTYTYRDALSSIFQQAGHRSHGTVDQKDPWAGQRRVNILLLGGDAAGNRTGLRTDSIILASIDTTTGRTVLLSLPRNLESFPMPPGPARDRFPYGFTGDGPLNPGLLNEVYEYAENHPEVVPGTPPNRRGPELIKGTVSEILGLPIDYYIVVDMFGFADIVDAMGGVRIRIDQPIPYGQRGDVLQAGDRRLNGKEALWYGRSRTDSDDYTRMGRQKCLLRALAKQADPQRVLTRFHRLAAATKRTISTDIPLDLMPAFIRLSGKVKDGARIDSLQFVPPLIHTGNPDFALIRRLSAKAIADSGRQSGASPSPGGSPVGRPDPSPPRPHSGRPAPDGATPTPEADHTVPTSLDKVCPS
ncbi:MAG: cell envelope-related transcriptional attenuator [Streptosporangiaceae bacterium]|jgi:anionic cell wall polymer biosynthesis LytR-Cps2A-Psr (LCP) family protein|nr:cell envelope-related transcriptional attenuator [Streptosporangiaceae bacterium]